MFLISSDGGSSANGCLLAGLLPLLLGAALGAGFRAGLAFGFAAFVAFPGFLPFGAGLAMMLFLVLY